MSARIAVLQTAREDGIENGAGDYTQLSFAGDCLRGASLILLLPCHLELKPD